MKVDKIITFVLLFAIAHSSWAHSGTRGNGDVITTVIPTISSFSNISLRFPATVRLHTQNVEKAQVTVELDSNLMRCLNIRVDGDTLHLGRRPSFGWEFQGGILV
jgi:hypothetical protein